MSLNMKHIGFMILFMSEICQACIVGPQNVEPNAEFGFVLTREKIELCNDCSMISITGPEQYENSPISHATFSVFSKSELISKSVSVLNSKSSPFEFVGIVSNSANISYQINIEYGASRCTRYQFTYKGDSNES